ncbi:Cu(I)-responsive transcriptional regulator [Leptospira kmetyi]|uniref:Cu(I)-responsive transcriptional regulator n=1 Tax=Leptospira kmetyi TaxID=408139 RepID=A0A2M9XN92_9LEPT|nr:Cu(I)-responsive transcriptional regulator [Leptospira kmetyi]AYV55302.1 Cu(I)-responsive transcriptional regulator [Leptospira kmetyi]EQA53750.1 Cu(I)-responsive transcriptional regulator [Leptospira kmetyi serovar Malaysia str. Bejo-Iso9]PJZ31037.1 Cu(I)-responsive transcriptional regulator [Leptospira kmetyi]PJZ40693.1 Cu(I)-responsive transcriptional regulator [Leptospira kmetyi]TGK16900.1 Cu(I)-responsive transcriptional regulator [Leptospira kmetyi]
MNIGDVSKESGVSAKQIRHYESIGLIPKARRTDSGYRTYSTDDVHILKFVKRARGMGFGLSEIKKLVGLWKNKSRASADVKQLALSHLKTLENKIVELQDMAATLKHLAKHCHGDDRPSCPILKTLSNETA